MITFNAGLKILVISAATAGCFLPVAYAQSPLVHLPFDGSVQNLGSAGEAKLYLDEGKTAPIYVAGKNGQAMYFAEGGVVAIPFNYDHADYPLATVTAWIKDDAEGGSRRNILSTGSGAGLNFLAMGSERMNLRLGRKTRYHKNNYSKGEWIFVAGVVDTQNGTVKIWQNDDLFESDGIETSTLPPATHFAPGEDASEKKAYIFIGKYSFRDEASPKFPITIDDVRLYSDALAPEQIDAIRNAGPVDVAQAPEEEDMTDEADGILEARPSGPPIAQMPEGGPVFDRRLPEAESDPATLPSFPTTGGKDLSGIDRPDNGPIDIVEEARKEAAEREANAATNNDSENADIYNDAETQVTNSGKIFASGEARYSALSGSRGDNIARLDLGDQFIRRIAIFVGTYSIPCKLNIEGVSADHFEKPVQEKTWENDCAVTDADIKSVDLDESTAIGRIRLCTHEYSISGKKVDIARGVKIYGDVIKADGSTTYRPAASLTKFSDCSDDGWRQDVLCPTGTLSTGVVYHYFEPNVTGGNYAITGLQLICRAVARR